MKIIHAENYRKHRFTAYVLLAAGLVMTAVGLAQGDYNDTLRKAVMICLECIGIG